MLTRALIVLLLVLNLGVALWWLLQPAAATVEHEPRVGGAALLELVEQPRPTATAGAGQRPLRGVALGPMAANSMPESCHRFGPFRDADAAASAMARLESRVMLARLRREWPGAGDSWRVYHQAASVEAAAGAAQRIADAGFDDYYVVREGVDAGSVALGLYRARARADVRADALRQAGFVVQVEPVGGGDPDYWIEVAAAPGFDASRAAADAGAGSVEDRGCDGLVPEQGVATG